MFGLPIRGVLHPFEWVRPAGNTDCKITQDAASHASKINPATGLHRAMALDIGDGTPDHNELLAVHAGKIAVAATVGSANLGIEWTEGAVVWQAIYAHNQLPHPVKLGQTVTLGQVVGHMGSTSTPSMPVAQHLHIQIGYLKGAEWVWLDPWPLITNANEGDDMVLGTILARITNRSADTHANTKFRKDPSTKNPEWSILPGATKLQPDFAVMGEAVAGTTQWFTAMLLVAGQTQRGYVHESTVGPLTPVEATDCTDAVTKATAPLTIRINAAKAALGS